MHNKILTSFKVRTAQWGRSNFFFQDSTSVEKETFKKHIGHLVGCSKKKGNVDNEMIIVFFSGTFVFSRKCLSTYCYIIWENLIVTMKFIVLPDHPASENPCPKVFYCSTFLLGQRPSNCLVETHTHITHIFNKKHMFVPSWHVKTPCADHVPFLFFASLAVIFVGSSWTRKHNQVIQFVKNDLLLFWSLTISMEHQTQQKTWRYWFWSTPGSPPKTHLGRKPPGIHDLFIDSERS